MIVEKSHFEGNKAAHSPVNEMVEFQVIQGKDNKWEIWEYNQGEKVICHGVHSDIRSAINRVRSFYGNKAEPRVIFEYRDI